MLLLCSELVPKTNMYDICFVMKQQWHEWNQFGVSIYVVTKMMLTSWKTGTNKINVVVNIDFHKNK